MANDPTPVERENLKTDAAATAAIAELPPLPVWNEPSLDPVRLGATRHTELMMELLQTMPNAAVLRQRRRDDTTSVAPVRFEP